MFDDAVCKEQSSSESSEDHYRPLESVGEDEISEYIMDGQGHLGGILSVDIPNIFCVLSENLVCLRCLEIKKKMRVSSFLDFCDADDVKTSKEEIEMMFETRTNSL